MKRTNLFLLIVLAASLLFSFAAVSAQCYGSSCCYPCYGNNCCYQPYTPPANCAVFISDVTYADGTYVTPGSSFVKTWRVRNNGTTTWNSNYKLVFQSGNQMSGPTFVNLPYSVAPGQTVDISVPLVAPTSGGTFKGTWMLQSDTGVNFGVGSNCYTAVWVQISTVQPSYPYYGPQPGYRPFPPRPAPNPNPNPNPKPKPFSFPSFPFPWDNVPWFRIK